MPDAPDRAPPPDDDPRDDAPPRPRSVRESLPPARSGAPEPARGGGDADRPRPGGPVPAPASTGEERVEGSRPTPVREAMEAERDAPQPVEPPSVTFTAGDQQWVARVEGRTTTGLPTDAGAPLLFVTFARAEAPDRRVLEVTAVARRLEDLDPGRLGVLLDEARPLPDAWEPGEFFPGTRKSRGSRR